MLTRSATLPECASASLVTYPSNFPQTLYRHSSVPVSKGGSASGSEEWPDPSAQAVRISACVSWGTPIGSRMGRRWPGRAPLGTRRVSGASRPLSIGDSPSAKRKCERAPSLSARRDSPSVISARIFSHCDTVRAWADKSRTVSAVAPRRKRAERVRTSHSFRIPRHPMLRS